MPELASLPRANLNIQAFQPLPVGSYFSSTPPPAPIPNESGLYKAKGRAALVGAIGQAAAALPDQINASYQQGLNQQTGNAVRTAYTDALAGNPRAGQSLGDFQANTSGQVTFKPEKPDSDAEKALLLLRQKHIENLNKPPAPTLYDQWKSPTPSQPITPLPASEGMSGGEGATGSIGSNQQSFVSPSPQTQSPFSLASFGQDVYSGNDNQGFKVDESGNPVEVRRALPANTSGPIATPQLAGVGMDGGNITPPTEALGFAPVTQTDAPSKTEALGFAPVTQSSTGEPSQTEALGFAPVTQNEPHPLDPTVLAKAAAESAGIAPLQLSSFGQQVYSDSNNQGVMFDESGNPIEVRRALPVGNSGPIATRDSGVAQPQLSGISGAQSASTTPTGVIGRGTSYGYKGDKYGGPSAASSTTGPAGNRLDHNSMAVSPDIEKMLKDQGYKFGDMVTMNTDKGPVTRRWDDRTATDTEAAKLKLKPLRGRFDFHADANGRPSQFNDAKITAIVPKDRASVAQSAPPTDDNQPQLAGFGGYEELGNDGAAMQSRLDQIRAEGGSFVPGMQRQKIYDAAENIGQSLTNIPNSEAGAAGKGAPVPIARSVETGDGPKHVVEDPYTHVLTITGADGAQFQIRPDKPNEMIPVKAASSASVPALLRAEAVRMGVWKDGMTSEQLGKAMEDKQIETGIIPPHLLPQATALARLVTQHPTLKHYPVIREAKETVDAGLANPDAGGFGDMAIVEGFQRMVNPGATVRTQTMQQMMKSAGLGQYTDLGFLMDHFKQGDKFAPEVRQRLKKLSGDIYERATKNAAPQLKALGNIAKSYGIANPEAFVNNVMIMSPIYDAGGQVVPIDGQPSPAASAAPVPATGVPGSSHDNPISVSSESELNAAHGQWVRSPSGKIGFKK